MDCPIWIWFRSGSIYIAPPLSLFLSSSFFFSTALLLLPSQVLYLYIYQEPGLLYFLGRWIVPVDGLCHFTSVQLLFLYDHPRFAIKDWLIYTEPSRTIFIYRDRYTTPSWPHILQHFFFGFLLFDFYFVLNIMAVGHFAEPSRAHMQSIRQPLQYNTPV